MGHISITLLTRLQSQMLLPCTIHALSSVEPSQFDRWLDNIRGEDLSRCDVTEEQRITLERIALAYRGFTLGHPRSSIMELFDPFIDVLLDLFESLAEHEAADDLLEDFGVFLEELLPAVCSRISLFQCEGLTYF